MFDDLKQGQSPQPSNESARIDRSPSGNSQYGQSQIKPKNIDDMFADVDPVNDNLSTTGSGREPLSGIQAGRIKPVSNTSARSSMAPSVDEIVIDDERSSKGKGTTITLIIILILVLAGAAYYFFIYQSSTENNFGNIIEANSNTNSNVNTYVNEEVNNNININENVNTPVLTDEELDDDSDGLSNAEEDRLGIDSLDPDTDNDGLFDREEVITYQTDPKSNDSDEDELSDYEEINIWQTDPNNSDTDDDGYLDGLEVANGYNPLGEGILEE